MILLNWAQELGLLKANTVACKLLEQCGVKLQFGGFLWLVTTKNPMFQRLVVLKKIINFFKLKSFYCCCCLFVFGSGKKLATCRSCNFTMPTYSISLGNTSQLQNLYFKV